jgi:long-subunit fatty acid transport protein
MPRGPAVKGRYTTLRGIMRSVTRLSSTLGAMILALSAASTAHAGGFTTTRFGGEHGHAATDDTTAIFYNPAGLAYGEGHRGYVEGLFAYRTVDYNRDAGAIDNPDAGPGTAGTPPDGIGANSGAATLGNAIASPFVGIATDAGLKGFGFGLGLSVPFGGQASWDKVGGFSDAKFPGAADSSARWASIEGSQRSVYLSLGAAWRTRDGRFGIGVAGNYVMSEIKLVRARNLDGTDDLLQANGALKEGRALLATTSRSRPASCSSRRRARASVCRITRSPASAPTRSRAS